ncbi:unnamed protein product [Rotaria sp. Silwood2]|nr:unnamed protein product [Rotaria sp. Silwood2]CAF3279891.1 unnamed protein product [Rotaria sp. Silwood2]CAF4283398.1 unnamed protein product [Rotaria sp. Silwood2]CAF4438731.1 unnamed protein product [Rotaria sp. Silwood2]
MGIFDATSLALTTTILQEINLVVLTISSLIYLFTILLNNTLCSNRINFLTINVCLSTITYAIYWSLFIMLTFLPNYFQMSSKVPMPQIYQNHLVCLGADRSIFINSYTFITLVLCPLILMCSSNISVFILAVRPRVRINTNQNQIETMSRVLCQTNAHIRVQTNSFELLDDNQTEERIDRIDFKRVSKRDIKILLNMGLMLGIFLLGWTSVYFLLVIAPSSLSNRSFLLYILGSFPSYSLLLNIILLYRYNHPLRKHIIMKFTNKYRQFVQMLQ